MNDFKVFLSEQSKNSKFSQRTSDSDYLFNSGCPSSLKLLSFFMPFTLREDSLEWVEAASKGRQSTQEGRELLLKLNNRMHLQEAISKASTPAGACSSSSFFLMSFYQTSGCIDCCPSERASFRLRYGSNRQRSLSRVVFMASSSSR